MRVHFVRLLTKMLKSHRFLLFFYCLHAFLIKKVLTFIGQITLRTIYEQRLSVYHGHFL